MRHLPKEAPKTVFMHTPLFVEYPAEIKAWFFKRWFWYFNDCQKNYEKLIKATEKEKSLPFDTRLYLLDLFNYYNVDTVFSGHNHFENFPDTVYNVRQIVMTSINYLNSWSSKETGKDFGPEYGNNDRGYYVVEINEKNEPIIEKRLV